MPKVYKQDALTFIVKCSALDVQSFSGYRILSSIVAAVKMALSQSTRVNKYVVTVIGTMVKRR